MREILPNIRERCADEIPPHLAYNIYWGCTSLDVELAGRAALAVAASERDDTRRIEWRIHAARSLAEQGDETMLEQLPDELGESGESWARLADAYRALRRYPQANDAARRAYELDPRNLEVLGAMEEASVRLGDLDGALECARTMLELFPYEHHGSERLAALLAKSLDVEPALDHSHRAVAVAPYCHNAHWARALALFVAGDDEGALRHSERSIAIQPPVEDDPPEDCVMMQRALAGDVDGVARCLAALAVREPESLFAEYKQMLVSGATDRRANDDTVAP